MPWLLRSTSLVAFAIGLTAGVVVVACGDDYGANSEAAAPPASTGALADASAADSSSSSTATSPPLCNGEGFCWENPLSHGARFRSIWSSGKDNDVWGVGYPGLIMHFDGEAWKQFPIASFASLTSVWGSGPNDVWAGGYEFAGQVRTVIFHFDGVAWSLSYSSQSQGTGTGFRHLNGIWGSGPKDVWAIGDDSMVLHFDGTSWTPTTIDVGTGGGAPPRRLHRIVGSAANDVWVLPEIYDSAVELFHFNGSTWKTVATNRTAGAIVNALWSTGPDVWLALSERADGVDAGPLGGTPVNELLLHFDGMQWTSAESPLMGSSVSMWGAAPNDVWAVGRTKSRSTPGVIHFDGAKWSAPLPIDPALGVRSSNFDLPSIWGAGKNSVWIHDGTFGRVLRLNGATQSWTASPRRSFVAPESGGASFTALWAAASDNIWMAGSVDDGAALAQRRHGIVAHFDGSAWKTVDLGVGGTIGSLAAMHASAANNLWCVGEKGTVVRYDGASFQVVPAATTGVDEATELTGTWTSGPNDVWIIGRKPIAGQASRTEAVAFHFDGVTWKRSVPREGELKLEQLTRIWGSGPKDVWMSGFNADSFRYDLFHFDGSSWTTSAEPGNVLSNAIWGTGPKDVWVGTWHYDGSTWKAAASDPHVALLSTWGRGPNDVWTISAMGEVLHWDGAKWSLVSVVASPLGVGGTPNDLLVVGGAGGGMILRKKL